MQILILSDAYLPASTLAHARMLHELALEFLRCGHKVAVLTPGHYSQRERMVRNSLDGIDILNFRSKPTRGVSQVRRAINESLLSFYAYRALNSGKDKTSFDLVINYSPTIFFGPLARWYKKQGAYVYLILRDFFPQWVIERKLIKDNSIIARYFRFFEHLNYRSSNLISVQSPANIEIFRNMAGCQEYPLDVLYNWTKQVSDLEDGFGSFFLNNLNLDEKFIFFYGGNIGYAQDIPYILNLAEQFLPQESVHFLLIGQGDQFENTRAIIKERNLFNVTLKGSVSQEEYQSLLAHVDVGLFTLAKSHSAHNFPGKIFGYLAAGLPILGAVNAGNDLIGVINQSGAGRVTVNGNGEDFYQDAFSIYSDHELRSDMSASGAQLLDGLFSVCTAADKILKAYLSRRQ